MQNCHLKQGVVESGSQHSVIYHTSTLSRDASCVRGPGLVKFSNVAAAAEDGIVAFRFVI